MLNDLKNFENNETHPAFGTQEEFEAKYGKTTEDGVLRFGEDYAYLHKSSELSLWDRISSAFWG